MRLGLSKFVRRFLRTSLHIRVAICHSRADGEFILLVRNRRGDGLLHLPGGRYRKGWQKISSIRAAVNMVKKGLGADLYRTQSLGSYKKGKIGLTEITVVTGLIDEIEIVSKHPDHDFMWYPKSALKEMSEVDKFTKYILERLPDMQAEIPRVA